MEEIQRLLNEAEVDTLAASDIVIGLTAQLGSEELLLQYTAECNSRRQQVAVYRNRVAVLISELDVQSVIELQLVLIQVRQLRDICQELRQEAEGLRNDWETTNG